eukprot:gene2455-biopygen5771
MMFLLLPLRPQDEPLSPPSDNPGAPLPSPPTSDDAEAAAAFIQRAIPMLDIWGIHITTPIPQVVFQDLRPQNPMQGMWPPYSDQCLNCRGFGHRTYLCPSDVIYDATGPSCSNCGGSGHRVDQCSSCELPDWDPQDPIHSDPSTNPIPSKLLETCAHCAGKGHFTAQCVSVPPVITSAEITCTRCGGNGHKKTSCPNPVSTVSTLTTPRESEEMALSMMPTGASALTPKGT